MDEGELRALMLPEQPRGLVAHTDRVVELAGRLAECHQLDVSRVCLAARAHDLLRGVPAGELLTRAREVGYELSGPEQAAPVLLHGPLAALELERRFGIDDDLVLRAVRWHTSGHATYGGEEWAVFIADKVEPDKASRRPGLEPIHALAWRSLERAALRYLDLRLGEALRRGWQAQPVAILARNALLARQGDFREE